VNITLNSKPESSLEENFENPCFMEYVLNHYLVPQVCTDTMYIFLSYIHTHTYKGITEKKNYWRRIIIEGMEKKTLVIIGRTGRWVSN
jgi:hypothetical protein